MTCVNLVLNMFNVLNIFPFSIHCIHFAVKSRMKGTFLACMLLAIK